MTHPAAGRRAVVRLAAPGREPVLARRWAVHRSLAGLPFAPDPVALVHGDGGDLLFERPPPGTPGSAVEHRVDATRTVAELGRLLGRVHRATDVAAPSVPVAAMVRGAAAALKAGEVEPGERDRAFAHMGGSRLAEILEAGEAVHGGGGEGSLVVGDASLENLRLDAGRATGFAAWTAAGTGDPHLDLAIAARSVAGWEPQLVSVLFENYDGAEVSLTRLDWYQLLTAVVP